jgi:Domain of unknown function (DUF2760)
LSRIVLAFRSFFAILFSGKLPADIAQELGFSPRSKPQPAAKPAPAVRAAQPSDGALQILGILQRDSRLIDFLMEDISAYSDDQVGAAVRDLHQQCRDSLNRYLRLGPVIDGVEGSPTKLDTNDPATVKLLGNVPASGKKAPSGVLRHKGWKAEKIDLPPLAPGSNASVIAPAEVEIE